MGDLSGLAGQPIEVNPSQSNGKRAKQELNGSIFTHPP